MRTRTLALGLVFAAACGGGDKKNNNPDASMQQQDGAPADTAAACTMLTHGALDQAGYNPGNAVAYNGDGGDAGDGHALTLQFEFYKLDSGAQTGTIDLSTGDNANYASCKTCVIAYSNEDGGKVFFQKSGTVTLTEDPVVNGHMNATFTNLELQEVTIADDYTSTPVANGQCATYGASLMVEHDKAPNAWTCSHDAYADGTNCDCVCGADDLDCAARTTVTNGCTANQICMADACVAAAPNDLCTAAPTLTLGTAVTGTTVGAYNDEENGLDDATCTNFAQPGADVTYKVHLTQGTQYTVSLSGLDSTFDASVYLLGPGAATVCDPDPITTCVKGADAGVEGEAETFQYTPTTTGDYYVIVDSYYADESGAFTLTVQ